MEIEEEKTEQKHLIPFEIKQQIVFYKIQGTLNNKEIAEEIFKYFGPKIGNSTVQRVWEDYEINGRNSNHWCTQGRHKALAPEEQEMLIETVKDNRFSSTNQLKYELKGKQTNYQ